MGMLKDFSYRLLSLDVLVVDATSDDLDHDPEKLAETFGSHQAKPR